MKSISTVTELKEAIRLLEIEQAERVILIKDQFHLIYENLNPLNLVRNYLKDIVSQGQIINDIFDNTIAVVAGYFSKKIIGGKSENSFQKIAGSVLQLGAIRLVSHFKEQIRNFAHLLIQSVFYKEETD